MPSKLSSRHSMLTSSSTVSGRLSRETLLTSSVAMITRKSMIPQGTEKTHTHIHNHTLRVKDKTNTEMFHGMSTCKVSRKSRHPYYDFHKLLYNEILVLYLSGAEKPLEKWDAVLEWCAVRVECSHSDPESTMVMSEAWLLHSSKHRRCYTYHAVKGSTINDVFWETMITLTIFPKSGSPLVWPKDTNMPSEYFVRTQ